jgi:acetoacetyl-CoA reductase
MRKIVLVTGGAKGIGEAIVDSLRNNNYFVIATYNSTKPASELDNVIYKKLDVTCNASCENLLNELLLDDLYPEILINNAGITKDAMFHKMTYDTWQEVINVNLLSLFNLTHPIFIKMKEKGFGRIVNISSINANKGQIGQVNYCAAKAGIQGFTKALALEGARYGVTVNTISPGYTETSMVSAIKPEILNKIKQGIPVGRLANVNEIAAAVCYLVSDLAAYTTAANIEVNGGMYSS